jgi:hypothetical protein
LAIGLAGLGLVGFLASQVIGGSDSGGSSSPEAAVQGLVDAVERQDPLSALAQMAPDEVRPLSAVFGELRDKASEAMNTGDVPWAGTSLDVTNLQMETTELGPDAARVTIRELDLTWSLDPTRLAPDLQEQLADDDDPQLSGTFSLSEQRQEAQSDGDAWNDPSVITVKDGGGWFVSPIHSAAGELIDEWNLDNPRVASGDFRSDRDRPKPPKDADALVSAITAAAQGLDVQGGLDLISADSFGLSEIYAGTIRDAIANFEREEGHTIQDALQIHLDAPKLSTESRDGKVFITVESVSGTWSAPDLDYDPNDCSEGYYEDGYYYDGYCDEDESTSGSFTLDGACLRAVTNEDDEGGFSECRTTDLQDLTGLTKPFVVAVHEDGGLRLSPIQTIVEYGKLIARHADGARIREVLEIDRDD